MGWEPKQWQKIGFQDTTEKLHLLSLVGHQYLTGMQLINNSYSR